MTQGFDNKNSYTAICEPQLVWSFCCDTFLVFFYIPFWVIYFVRLVESQVIHKPYYQLSPRDCLLLLEYSFYLIYQMVVTLLLCLVTLGPLYKFCCFSAEHLRICKFLLLDVSNGCNTSFMPSCYTWKII